MARTVNTLRKIIAVQDQVIECKRHGATQTWIYSNVIAPVYFISKSTFDKYMGINAKKELKEIIENNADSNRQTDGCNAQEGHFYAPGDVQEKGDD